MHTRATRKAKSAAAEFVKRVISGHDTSPGPSAKSTKSQKSKPVSKQQDTSRSPSRGRSPAKASKSSPAPKPVPATKTATPKATGKTTATLARSAVKLSSTTRIVLMSKPSASKSSTKKAEKVITASPARSRSPQKAESSRRCGRAGSPGSQSEVQASQVSPVKCELARPSQSADGKIDLQAAEAIPKSPVKTEPTEEATENKETSAVNTDTSWVNTDTPGVNTDTSGVNTDTSGVNTETSGVSAKTSGVISESPVEGSSSSAVESDAPEGADGDESNPLIQGTTDGDKTELTQEDEKKEETPSEPSSEHPSEDGSAPAKRGRGRPRKYPITKTAPSKEPKLKAPPPPQPDPVSRSGRPRGRPRKYPLLEGEVPKKAPPKPVVKKTERERMVMFKPEKSYSESMMSSYGSLNIVIKDDYMTKEGGMISPRHPTILCEQDEFFRIFGLIKTSELQERLSRKHTLHRAAGGKLRRMIKPKICPEMVYRNFLLNKSNAIGAVPDEWDSSDEYDDSSPMAKLVKSHSAPTTPNPRALLASPAKVSLLAKVGLKDSPIIFKDTEKPKKEWLKPPPKTPKRSSIEDSLEAVKGMILEASPKTKGKADKLAKPPLKKQLSEPMAKSKVLKLETKSKSLQLPKTKHVVSTYKFKPTGGFRPLAPPPKTVEEPSDPSMAPSRRSARNKGSQRKQWWHLLRANPDEYIPDEQWEEEEAIKEKKRQRRLKKQQGDYDTEEESLPEMPEVEIKEEPVEHPEEVVVKKKKKKKKKKPPEDEAEVEGKPEVVQKIAVPGQKREAEADEELPSTKIPKLEASEVVTETGLKKKKKKKKKHPEEWKDQDVKVQVDSDQRGSVLKLQRGSKCRSYMVFDSSSNLVSMHSDPVIYSKLANTLVSLVRQEGFHKISHEVIELTLPKSSSLVIKEKLRNQICEKRASMDPDMVYEESESSCITPHMCQVCWINDHMYCINMKRIARDLPKAGGCLHYTLCRHYRHISRDDYYSHCAMAKFGMSGLGQKFSISKMDNPEYMKRSRILSEEGTSITISGGRLLAGDKEDHNPVVIKVNNAAEEQAHECMAPQTPTDLVCHEELGDSDTDNSAEVSKSKDLLKKHLYVRARQIAQSLGYPSIQDAMQGQKSGSKEEVVAQCQDSCEQQVAIQDFSEVEIGDSDSDSDEEEVTKRKYGVPLNSKLKESSHHTNEERMLLHLMPVLHSSNQCCYYVKNKARRVLKVQFGGLAQYNQAQQEWQVQDDSYTMQDVTRKYLKHFDQLPKCFSSSRWIKISTDNCGNTTIRRYKTTEDRAPPTLKEEVKDDLVGQPKVMWNQEVPHPKDDGNAKVIWSSELALLERSSDESKSSPDGKTSPSKKRKLSSGKISEGTASLLEAILQSPVTPGVTRTPGLAGTPGSGGSSPCLSQGSAVSTSSRSSAQGQQLLMASPVKLPRPQTSMPAELHKYISANKDGNQTLTFTTKDIRQCSPELIQYIKSANLVGMIQKTLTDERNSIKKLLDEGNGDVSALYDSREQSECLLLAVKSESKDVKEKLVDLEMNVLTEQTRVSRLERKKEKLRQQLDNTQKKMTAFKKAMDRVNKLINSGSASASKTSTPTVRPDVATDIVMQSVEEITLDSLALEQNLVYTIANPIPLPVEVMPMTSADTFCDIAAITDMEPH